MPRSDGGLGRREALIIAAGRFQDSELAGLRSPSRDAAELAKVLGNPMIGDFNTRILLDKPGHLLREEIDAFFAGRQPHDLLVLYLSCHGVKDASGRLNFAVSTTKLDRLASTGISADFIYEIIDHCDARKILLLLDCCYSGAYFKGHRPKAAGRAAIRPLDGRSRAVITSSTELEYAFEIDTGQVTGTAAPSVFTSALVEGLRTGQADRDGDGLVSVDDLYVYVFDAVRAVTPHQTPEKKWGDIRGDFVIARNPRPPARQSQPPSTGAEAAGRPRGTTRRVLLGLAAVSATGLAVAGWDLARKPTPGRPKPKTAPPAIELWRGPADVATIPVEWGPTVASGVVYAASASELYALRASDGRRIWEVQADARDGLAMSDVSIFTWSWSENSNVIALRASNGTTSWRSRFALSAAFGSAGPAFANNLVFVADGNGDVYGLSALNGTKIWRSSTGTGAPSGLVVVPGYICVAGTNVGALRIDDGASAWTFPVDQGTVPGLAAAGSTVFVPSENGKVYALHASNGTEIWSSDADRITLAGGILYAATGERITALQAAAGKPIWTFPCSDPYVQLVTEIAVYVSDSLGKVHALRVNDGLKIWSFTTGGGVVAATSSHDVIYVASNNLYALRASNGEEVWSYPIESQKQNALTIAGGALYVGSVGGVYAFQVQEPRNTAESGLRT
jgi:outer membrane protein assembly factor BamB